MANVRGSVGLYNGKQCYNFTADQHTVQDLLNRIPAAQGGADGSLTDPINDRKISQSLYEAILRFQRANHCVPDGHIDPGERTIQVLTQLAAEAEKKPVPPPPPPPPEKTSTYFAIHFKSDAMGVQINDWLLEVTDLTNNRDAVYLLSYQGANPGPIPPKFEGKLSIFHTRGPEVLTRLDCDATYGTWDHPQGLDSALFLLLPSGAIRIPMWRHMFERVKTDGSEGSTQFSNRFQFIR